MRKYLPYLVPAACLAVFFISAAWKISFPGLQYDEMLFANGAMGDLDGTFVFKKIGFLPVFAMPYFGAVTIWIYWFIFHVFGVSVWSIRLPMILSGTIGLAGYYYLAKKHFGARAAWMATSLLALNPVFVWATRQAYTGIEFPLQVFSLVALLCGAPAWVTAGLFVAGVYYKISFVWWAAGALLAAFVAFPRTRRAGLISGAAIGAFLLFWRWYIAFPLEHEIAADFSRRWLTMKLYAAALLEGVAFYDYLFEKSRDVWLPATYLMSAVFLGALFFGVGSPKPDRRLRFLVVSLLASAAIIFLSSRATAYWHVLPLLPFFVLLAGTVMARSKQLGIALWALYALQLCQIQVSFLERARWDARNDRWSMAIYSLISWCRQEQRKCSSLEWGTHNQLLAFVGDPRRVSDFSRTPTLDPDTFYVGYFRYPVSDARKEFFAKTESAGWEASIDREIYEGNTPVFALYRLTRSRDEKAERPNRLAGNQR